MKRPVSPAGATGSSRPLPARAQGREGAFPPARGGGVQAVERAIHLLEVLADRDAGVSDLARETGLHKATVHRLIRTLASAGLVQTVPDGTKYRLGLRLAEFGGKALARLDLREVALPFLRELRDRTRLTVHMAVLDRTDVVYIEKLDSPANLRMASHVGTRNPVYCTALGKALLAAMPGERAREVIGRVKLVPRTPTTLSDPQALWQDLIVTRRRGFAVDNAENEEGIRCVGAAVFGHGGQAVAAISASGPLFSVHEEEIPDLGRTVKETAERISQAMGWTGTA
ncbi:MAG: IclR family transcriptional regulator [Firmicutes bacterium]|nr:IclR family transcriptional regulator [Bacillota bacterium]